MIAVTVLRLKTPELSFGLPLALEDGAVSEAVEVDEVVSRDLLDRRAVT
jgi:hypothetical protein